jgi:hypothetical protein
VLFCRCNRRSGWSRSRVTARPQRFCRCRSGRFRRVLGGFRRRRHRGWRHGVRWCRIRILRQLSAVNRWHGRLPGNRRLDLRLLVTRTLRSLRRRSLLRDRSFRNPTKQRHQNYGEESLSQRVHILLLPVLRRQDQPQADSATCEPVLATSGYSIAGANSSP